MKRKILVVDDEPEVVELVKNRLENNDYEVITANDGEEALYRANTEMPNLIILDIMMPVIDGYDDKKIAEQCGADAYIPKPYSLRVQILVFTTNIFLL